MSETWDYDGASTLIYTADGLVDGDVYRLACGDPDSSSGDGEVTGGSVTLTVSDIGGLSAGDPFQARVMLGGPGSSVGSLFSPITTFAANIFEFGSASTTGAGVTATWAYDGVDEVSVTFTAVGGVSYLIDLLTSAGFSNVAGGPYTDGTEQTLTANITPPSGEGFYGVLFNNDASLAFTNRVFTEGVAGAGVPGNPGGGGGGPGETEADSNIVGLVTPAAPGEGGGGGGETTGGCGLGGIRFFESYFWKFIVTNLNLETVTMLDRLASDRQVTKTLGDALEIALKVPSDNPRVNIPYTDLDPKVGEGTRCLLGFRHEGPGEWVIRASTLIFQAHDGPENDTAKTTVTGWDPWRYLDLLPVINTDTDAPGRIFAAGTSWDDVVTTLLTEAEANYNDVFIDYGQTGFYTGTIETCPGPTDGNPTVSFLNGTSIGECLRRVMATGLCRIILDPIYDPVNRPGILVQLSLYDPVAGEPQKPTAVFGWNQMPRSAASLDRLQDGTQRSNNVQFYHGKGGPPVALKTDATSEAKYRRYYRSRFIVAQGGNVETVEDLATADLLLRADGIETLTVSPTPERAKVPFLDYDIGDYVRVQTNRTFRQAIDDFYRVKKIPVAISDEALETAGPLEVERTTVPGS